MVNWQEALLDPETKKWADRVKAISQFDLFTFAHTVLNYDLMIDRVHGPICAFLTDSFLDLYVFPKLVANGVKKLPLIFHPNSLRLRKKLLLTCRDTFKSTITSIALPLFMLKENPNLKILMDSEVKDNAKDRLRAIKAHLEGNLFFRALYGNWVNPKKWAEEQIIIAQAEVESTPSIMVTGANCVTTGHHFDIIICDDLHSWENTESNDLIDGVIQHWQELKAQLKPNGIMLIVGTPYRPNDLYAHIVANFKNDYDFLSQFAYMSDGNLWFPERISEKYLKDRQGVTIRQREMYQAHFLGDPKPLSERKIYINKIHFHNHFSEELLKKLNLFVFIDPANSKKKYASQTAIGLCGMDWTKDFYLLDYVCGRWEPNQVISESLNFIGRYYPYKIQTVGAEAESGYEFFVTALRKELSVRNLTAFAFEELKTHGKSKESRVLAMDSVEMLINSGRFHCKPTMTEFLDEAENFPKSITLDLLDGCSYGAKMAYPPLKPEEPKHNTEWDSMQEHFKRQIGIPEKDGIYMTHLGRVK